MTKETELSSVKVALTLLEPCSRSIDASELGDDPEGHLCSARSRADTVKGPERKPLPQGYDQSMSSVVGNPPKGVETPVESGLAPNDQQRLRKELIRLVGGGPDFSPQDVRSAFSQGVTTVRSLQETGQIDEETAGKILHALATLYTNALVTQFSEQMLGFQRVRSGPSFLGWWTGSWK